AIELKRTATGMSAEKAVEYVRATMDARSATSVLIVCASQQAMPAGLRNGEMIGLVGANGLAVCYPPGGDRQILNVAYSLARTIAQIAVAGSEAERLLELDTVVSLVTQAQRRLAGIKQVEQGL